MTHDAPHIPGMPAAWVAAFYPERLSLWRKLWRRVWP
jgi:hypothetical protein